MQRAFFMLGFSVVMCWVMSLFPAEDDAQEKGLFNLECWEDAKSCVTNFFSNGGV